MLNISVMGHIFSGMTPALRSLEMFSVVVMALWPVAETLLLGKTARWLLVHLTRCDRRLRPLLTGALVVLLRARTCATL